MLVLFCMWYTTCNDDVYDYPCGDDAFDDDACVDEDYDAFDDDHCDGFRRG